MVQADSSRDQIKASLNEKADAYWANYDTYDTVFEDAEKNYVAKQTWDENGIAVTMIKYSATDVTPEMMEKWRADPIATQMACNPNLSREELPDQEGNKCWHMMMQMPMMISNRSIVTVFYQWELEDGTKCVMHSSLGNDAIAESIADKIGSNVIANNICTKTTFKPAGSGVDITMLVSMDPAGMIPGFIKNRISTRLANAGLIMANYLRDGTVPEPMF